MNPHQPHLSDSYGQLLQRLRKDLQLDASTDLLPGSIAAALAGDTSDSARLAYTAPSLINAWANFGSGFSPAGYLKDPMGFVHLRGHVGGGVSGTVAFVLPPGFRPVALEDYPTVASGAPAGCFTQVSLAGNVTLFTTAAAFHSLSGITFLAEN